MDQDAADGVWPGNVAAVRAFLAVSTQWRMVGERDGRVMAIGLDYTAVETGLRLAGIDLSPELWGELRLVEAGAIEGMNAT